jgi:hypothetical protein
MNRQQAVASIMALFNEEYPGKFTLSANRAELWNKLLSDIKPEVILAAATQLVGTDEWPPPVARVRRKALEIQKGNLYALTGDDAWQHVLVKIQRPDDVELTDLEKSALKQTSTLFDLQRSTNIAADRATFVRVYNELARRERIEESTLPEVRQLVESRRAERAKALPLPAEPRTPKELIEGDEAPDPEFVERTG